MVSCERLVQKGEAIEDFRKRLLIKYLPVLKYRMGEKYFRVTEGCLSGGFNDDTNEAATSLKDLGAEELYILEYEQTQKFLQRFAKHAVEELKKCAV